MVKMEDMLIIVFLDYGLKIIKYLFYIREGRIERYDLLFFIVILDKVVVILG